MTTRAEIEREVERIREEGRRVMRLFERTPPGPAVNILLEVDSLLLQARVKLDEAARNV